MENTSHGYLVKHWWRATGGRAGLRVAVPDCGGCGPGLAFLYRQGHTVTGLEHNLARVDAIFGTAQLLRQTHQLSKLRERFPQKLESPSNIM